MGEICATGGLAGCATHVTPSASSVTIPDLRNPCDGAGCAPATPASHPTNAAALPTLGLETLSTYPMSSAAQIVSCDRSATQARVRAAGTPERIGKAYDVTVTVDGPSRWVVALAAQ